MSKKLVLPRVAPLQRVVAEPITDPVQQAAIDKARKRQKRRGRKGQTQHSETGR